MRFLRLLLLLFATLVAGLSVAGAAQATTGPTATGPAAAPDCANPTRTPLPELLDQADAVLTGTVDVVFPAVTATTFEVDVTEVHKVPEAVEWGAQVAVRTPRGDCRLEGVRREARWLFVGNVDGQDRLVVTAVGGSQRLTPAVQARVDRLLAEAAPEPAPQLELVADSDPPSFWPLALPGVVLAGLGLLVWVLARALGRPKER